MLGSSSYRAPQWYLLPSWANMKTLLWGSTLFLFLSERYSWGHEILTSNHKCATEYSQFLLPGWCWLAHQSTALANAGSPKKQLIGSLCKRILAWTLKIQPYVWLDLIANGEEFQYLIYLGALRSEFEISDIQSCIAFRFLFPFLAEPSSYLDLCTLHRILDHVVHNNKCFGSSKVDWDAVIIHYFSFWCGTMWCGIILIFRLWEVLQTASFGVRLGVGAEHYHIENVPCHNVHFANIPPLARIKER